MKADRKRPGVARCATCRGARVVIRKNKFTPPGGFYAECFHCHADGPSDATRLGAFAVWNEYQRELVPRKRKL